MKSHDAPKAMQDMAAKMMANMPAEGAAQTVAPEGSGSSGHQKAAHDTAHGQKMPETMPVSKPNNPIPKKK